MTRTGEDILNTDCGDLPSQLSTETARSKHLDRGSKAEMEGFCLILQWRIII